MDYEEMKKQPAKRLGPGGTIVVGVILIVIGILSAFVLGHSNMKEGDASSSWPHVEGVISVSEVTSEGTHVESTSRYHTKIIYDYVVENKTFTSDRLDFRLGGHTYDRVEARAIVAQYPKGKKIAVYYKPEDPSLSCLEPGLRVGGAFSVGIGCILIGIIVVASGIFAKIKAIGSGG